MRLQPAHLLAAMLGSLFGILVGLFLGGEAAPVTTSEPVVLAAEPASAPATEDAVLRELRDLSRRLDELAMQQPAAIPALPWESEGAPATPPVERDREPVLPAEPAGTAAPVTVQLPAELTDWMVRIEKRLAMSSANNSTQLALPAPGSVSAPPPMPSLDDVEQETFERSHYLWSLQDVVDTYGMPDVVHGEGSSIEWEYKYENGGELDDMHFVFTGGLCIRAYAH